MNDVTMTSPTDATMDPLCKGTLTGEPDAAKVARPVRGGAVGKGATEMATTYIMLGLYLAGRLLYRPTERPWRSTL